MKSTGHLQILLWQGNKYKISAVYPGEVGIVEQSILSIDWCEAFFKEILKWVI